jgi:hypothetical protein
MRVVGNVGKVAVGVAVSVGPTPAAAFAGAPRPPSSNATEPIAMDVTAP